MRLRNVKGSKETIAANPFIIFEPEQYKGKWHELFQNEQPIHIEVGMGMGKFIHQLALQNPDINYIGIEKYSNVLVRALQRRSDEITDNLYYLRFDAEKLDQIFSEEEVQRIYLNFSDPWPKEKHAKRRLTSSDFLKKYDTILSEDGILAFKTDNKGLFDFSVQEFEKTKFKLRHITYDLHADQSIKNNVMTEYEEKFKNAGMPIYQLVVSKNIHVKYE